jgi:hypothetical protein
MILPVGRIGPVFGRLRSLLGLNGQKSPRKDRFHERVQAELVCSEAAKITFLLFAKS